MAGSAGTLPGEARSWFLEVRNACPRSEAEWEKPRGGGEMSVGARIDTDFGRSWIGDLGGSGGGAEVSKECRVFSFPLSPCSLAPVSADPACTECAEVRAGVYWDGAYRELASKLTCSAVVWPVRIKLVMAKKQDAHNGTGSRAEDALNLSSG